MTVAGVLVVVGLLLFLLFLDRFIHRLRPVAVAALVADAGRRAFESAARVAAEPDAPELVAGPYVTSTEPAFVVRSGKAGAIQAVGARGLVGWAREHDCLLVLRHTVGDFVPTGAVLVEVHGGPPDRHAAQRRLQDMIALGVERTIDQDPAFAIPSWSASRTRRCRLR